MQTCSLYSSFQPNAIIPHGLQWNSLSHESLTLIHPFSTTLLILWLPTIPLLLAIMIYTPSLMYPIDKRVGESASCSLLNTSSTPNHDSCHPSTSQPTKSYTCIPDWTHHWHNPNAIAARPTSHVNMNPQGIHDPSYGQHYHHYGLLRPEGHVSPTLGNVLFPGCSIPYGSIDITTNCRERISKQQSLPTPHTEELEVDYTKTPMYDQDDMNYPSTSKRCIIQSKILIPRKDQYDGSMSESCPSLKPDPIHSHLWAKGEHGKPNQSDEHYPTFKTPPPPPGLETMSIESQRFQNRLLYFPQMHQQICSQMKQRELGGNHHHHHQQQQQTQSPFGDVNQLSPIRTVLPFLFGRTNQLTDNIIPIVPEEVVASKTLHRTMSDWSNRAMQRANGSADKIRRLRFRRSKQTGRLLEMYRKQSSDPTLNNGDLIANQQDDWIATNPTTGQDTHHTCPDCRRVVLNVSGLKFETWLSVLDSRPSTLLGCAEKRDIYWDVERCEYFFDRHRPSFEAIFNYYQYGGRLKRPTIVSDDIFLRELEFFQMEPEALEIYKKNEGYVPEVIILPEKAWKRKLWLLFEYPETSILAFVFSVTSVVFTIISIILFCVETLPAYAQTHCEPGDRPNFLDPFFIIETACTVWFTLELIIRFISCPCQTSFVKDIKNLVDVCAIAPYYITLTNVLISFSCEGAKSSASLAFLRVIRLIRVFKLTKHSSGLQVLVLTFKESVEGLGLFLVAFIVCILVFSSTIYYVEGSQIESIPDAFWWAVITMCTVGYGDKVPKGPLGKIVGSVCAVAGVLTLAIPVPIITENFNKFYAHKTGRGRR